MKVGMIKKADLFFVSWCTNMRYIRNVSRLCTKKRTFCFAIIISLLTFYFVVSYNRRRVDATHINHLLLHRTVGMIWGFRWKIRSIFLFGQERMSIVMELFCKAQCLHANVSNLSWKMFIPPQSNSFGSTRKLIVLNP